MRPCTALTAALWLVSEAFAQDTGAVNTATVTDATAAPQTPATVPAATSTVASNTPVATTGANPVTVATIQTTANAPSVTVSDISSDVIKPTVVAAVAAQDLFAQIASDDPISVLNGAYTHPVTPLGVNSSYLGTSGLPIATNNYFGNLMVGDRTNAVYAMPYSLFWKTNQGLCAWNTDDTKYVFGSYTTESTAGPHYYYSGTGNCPIGLTSAEMNTSHTLVTSAIDHQSVDLTFTPTSGSGSMVIPIVQGNAFLTAKYSGQTPQLFSEAAFTSSTGVTFKSGTAASVGSKYRVTINNGDTWLLYIFPTNTGSDTSFVLSSTQILTGPSSFSGVVQIAKLPLNYAASDEAVYDSAAGTYATQNVISGTSTGTVGVYNFDFGAVSVTGNTLLSFLFPHQIASVSSGTATSLKLWSNTKGQMQAYSGNVLSFTETDLPTDIQFLPWSPLGNLQNYSVAALQAIATAANSESAQSMSSATDLNSMYYAGKALAKYAQICLAINDVLGKDATSCVEELESSIALFIDNQNIYPLVYDTVWKGAVSSCGNSGCDFGNAWYNDHHFHYGYFVYTAAVIAHIDSSWLTTKNKAYINTLVRDFANPSTSDTAFPQFRSFDWYAGHSWAHGITASGDGKDEESSSEDYNAIYGMKLWGKVIGDASMEGRGNLMLSVMRRSMQSYMLMASDNTVEPAAFVPQFAAGITFMNKVDHTTYFGQLEQYIQGIHMIPLTPISAFIRTPTFVAEEWSAVIKPILSTVTDGWLGILMANYAIANSTGAYEFFSSSSFSSSYLDNGASLTWYLTYAAGLGGAGDFDLAVDSSNGQVSTATVSAVQPTSTTASSSSSIKVLSTTATTTKSSTSPILKPSVSGSAIIVEIKSAAASGETATAATLAAPSTTSTALPIESSTKVTLGISGDLHVSCPGGLLMVGQSIDVITIYDNGTLSCGGQNAFLYGTSSSSTYAIDLSLARASGAIGSNFTLNGTTLMAFLDSSNLAKRQTTSMTQQQLAFAYGPNNVVMAVLAGSTSNMTTFTPQAAIVSAATTSSVVAQTTSIVVSSSPSSPSSSGFMNSTSTIVSSTASTSAISGESAAMAGAGTQVTSSSSDADVSGTSSSADSDGLSGAESSTGASTGTGSGSGAGVGSQASSTTVTYVTTINGQATTATTVVPVEVVYVTSMHTSTICGQCIATSTASAAPAAATEAATEQDQTSVVNASAASADDSTDSASDSSSSSSSDNNVVADSSNASAGSSSASPLQASASTLISSSKSSTATLPVVSANTLPISTSGSSKLFMSLSTMLGLLMISLI